MPINNTVLKCMLKKTYLTNGLWTWRFIVIEFLHSNRQTSITTVHCVLMYSFELILSLYCGVVCAFNMPSYILKLSNSPSGMLGVYYSSTARHHETIVVMTCHKSRSLKSWCNYLKYKIYLILVVVVVVVRKHSVLSSQWTNCISIKTIFSIEISSLFIPLDQYRVFYTKGNAGNVHVMKTLQLGQWHSFALRPIYRRGKILPYPLNWKTFGSPRTNYAL